MWEPCVALVVTFEKLWRANRDIAQTDSDKLNATVKVFQPRCLTKQTISQDGRVYRWT
jgi:hypothetical protein